eukprot:10201503-Ditylum_brightwellii.AAC.2
MAINSVTHIINVTSKLTGFIDRLLHPPSSSLLHRSIRKAVHTCLSQNHETTKRQQQSGVKLAGLVWLPNSFGVGCLIALPIVLVARGNDGVPVTFALFVTQ